jgi:hypothetical protein
VRCDVTAGTDLRDRDVDISSQPKLSIDAKWVITTNKVLRRHRHRRRRRLPATTVGKVEEAKEAEKRRAGEPTAAGHC